MWGKISEEDMLEKGKLYIKSAPEVTISRT